MRQACPSHKPRKSGWAAGNHISDITDGSLYWRLSLPPALPPSRNASGFALLRRTALAFGGAGRGCSPVGRGTRHERDMWQHNYEPVAAILGLSALVAAIPIFVLFFLLGVKRKPTWMAAMSALASALLVALAVYGMPVKLAIMSTLFGAAFG